MVAGILPPQNVQDERKLNVVSGLYYNNVPAFTARKRNAKVIINFILTAALNN